MGRFAFDVAALTVFAAALPNPPLITVLAVPRSGVKPFPTLSADDFAGKWAGIASALGKPGVFGDLLLNQLEQFRRYNGRVTFGDVILGDLPRTPLTRYLFINPDKRRCYGVFSK